MLDSTDLLNYNWQIIILYVFHQPRICIDNEYKWGLKQMTTSIIFTRLIDLIDEVI